MGLIKTWYKSDVTQFLSPKDKQKLQYKLKVYFNIFRLWTWSDELIVNISVERKLKIYVKPLLSTGHHPSRNTQMTPS